jgi:hypothetical protein
MKEDQKNTFRAGALRRSEMEIILFGIMVQLVIITAVLDLIRRKL